MINKEMFRMQSRSIAIKIRSQAAIISLLTSLTACGDDSLGADNWTPGQASSSEDEFTGASTTFTSSVTSTSSTTKDISSTSSTMSNASSTLMSSTVETSASTSSATSAEETTVSTSSGTSTEETMASTNSATSMEETTASTSSATSTTPEGGSPADTDDGDGCLGGGDSTDNVEAAANNLGAISVGHTSNWSGALHFNDPNCDSVDYYAMEVVGSVSQVRFEMDVEGNGNIEMELRSVSGHYMSIHVFESSDPRPFDVVISPGQYYVRVTIKGTGVNDLKSAYKLKVLVPDASKAKVDPKAGDSWMQALPKGDISEMDYTKVLVSGLVGSLNDADYYSFEADAARMGYIAGYSKFGKASIRASRVVLQGGKAVLETMAEANIRAGVLEEMQVPLDPDVSTLYILEVRRGEPYGSDYSIYVGPEWEVIGF